MFFWSELIYTSLFVYYYCVFVADIKSELCEWLHDEVGGVLSWQLTIVSYLCSTHTQPFYGPFTGTTRVSQGQKRTSGLYGARED